VVHVTYDDLVDGMKHAASQQAGDCAGKEEGEEEVAAEDEAWLG